MKIEGIDKVLIIGSGPIVIGQACEFDYSGTQASTIPAPRLARPCANRVTRSCS